jgi:hypothetical protein
MPRVNAKSKRLLVALLSAAVVCGAGGASAVAQSQARSADPTPHTAPDWVAVMRQAEAEGSVLTPSGRALKEGQRFETLVPDFKATDHGSAAVYILAYKPQ